MADAQYAEELRFGFQGQGCPGGVKGREEHRSAFQRIWCSSEPDRAVEEAASESSTRDLLGQEREELEVELYRQYELLGISRAAYYYEPRAMSALNVGLMRLRRAVHPHPFYGVEKMTQWLR